MVRDAGNMFFFKRILTGSAICKEFDSKAESASRNGCSSYPDGMAWYRRPLPIRICGGSWGSASTFEIFIFGTSRAISSQNS